MSDAEKLLIALKALAFYADPTTYHGIAIIADPPTGGFDQDWSANADYEYEKPGRRAREAFEEIGENYAWHLLDDEETDAPTPPNT